MLRRSKSGEAHLVSLAHVLLGALAVAVISCHATRLAVAAPAVLRAKDVPAKVVLVPTSPYPRRYGTEGPSGLLWRARAFAPGQVIDLAGRLPDGITAPPDLGIEVALSLTDDAHQRSAPLASGTLRTGAGPGLDGKLHVTLPAWPDGEYTVVARLAAGGAKVERREKVFLTAAFAPLRAEAAAAIASARTRLSAARDSEQTDLLRGVSFPSVEMLLEDADIRWNDFVRADRDWPYVRTQLETARHYARLLEVGKDPYQGVTGKMIKAYRDELDGTLQPYALYVPRRYSSEQPWPLIVSLHGAYSNHRVNLRRVFGFSNRPGEDDHEATYNDVPLPDVDMIVVSPYGRGEFMGYVGLGERDVLRVLSDVRRAYRVDDDRVYLTGLSMGGNGTWHLGLRHPDLFAALFAVCPVTDLRRWTVDKEPALHDPGRVDRATPLALAENALNQRVFIFHGNRDQAVPVEDSRKMAARMSALGYKAVRYQEIAGADHAGAWETAYKDGAIFKMLAGVRRDPFPRKVVYRTYSPRYSGAYWLRVDAMATSREMAEVTGEQDGKLFDVRTKNVAGVSLRLDPRHLPGARTVRVRIDGIDVYDGPARPVLTFAPRAPARGRGAARWAHVRTPASKAMPDYALGFLSRSLPLGGRHIYVYGTRGPREVVEAARATARSLADWGPGGHVDLAVKADDEVTAVDMARANLVLVGGARVNGLVGRMARELALRDEADALTAGAVKVTSPDRAYRLVQRNPLAPGSLVIVYGAETVRGLEHVAPFARPPSRDWTSETTYDYLVWDGDGALKVSGVLSDEWTVR